MAIENPTYTESELLMDLQSRNNIAYQYLYKNYSASLLHVIQQFIPDSEIAADVLQEVFITIWQQIDKYDQQKGKLFTWMVRITRNAAINKLRSKIYKSQNKNDSLENYVTAVEFSHTEADNINKIGLRKEVHKLRPEYKDVIELSYYNGFTYEEIAKTLQIPLGTVKSRLRYALIELRKHFV